MRGGGSAKRTSNQVRQHEAHNHCLYTASSRADGFNLTHFRIPEPGLTYTPQKTENLVFKNVDQLKFYVNFN